MSLYIASRFPAARRLCSKCQLSARCHRQLRQNHTHQGPVALPPSRLDASVQRANRPQLGACTTLGGTAICTSGSGSSTTPAARRLCSESQPPSARCLHQLGRHSHMHIRIREPTALSSVPALAWAAQPYAHQGPVAIPPPRLGASVQRANHPQLGSCTSLGGTAISTSGFGSSTSPAARRLWSRINRQLDAKTDFDDIATGI
ncbi:hypothetical protein AAC387_Pa12g2324 [Persea americana]